MQRKKTGILIFPQVEVLDFCGPYEVFSVTRLNEQQRRKEPSPFDVFLIAEKAEVITTSGGMQVVAQHSIQDCPPLDILVIPGGWGVRTEIQNQPLIGWIARTAPNTETLASVCTGAALLAQAGLLKDRRATTHWKALTWLRELFPEVHWEEELHVVEDGGLITSAGISAGIDLALRVVARYHGLELALATARHMEYAFQTDNLRRS